MCMNIKGLRKTWIFHTVCKKKKKKASDADVTLSLNDLFVHLLETDASLTDGELISAASEHSDHSFDFSKFWIKINK